MGFCYGSLDSAPLRQGFACAPCKRQVHGKLALGASVAEATQLPVLCCIKLQSNRKREMCLKGHSLSLLFTSPLAKIPVLALPTPFMWICNLCGYLLITASVQRMLDMAGSSGHQAPVAPKATAPQAPQAAEPVEPLQCSVLVRRVAVSM
eukprot:3838102-Amphidinium_carterae.1